jgi:diguanylate cyclase (GGDEF)-like protein/PAS domain S-box-containing protein
MKAWLTKSRIPILLYKQRAWIIAGLLLIGLYLIHRVNFLLFHTIAELFSIIIAFSIFIFAWNARRYLDNGAILVIGIAFLFVGAIDLIHTLTYQGMNIFPGLDANLPTQLWLAARYLQSISMLVAVVAIRRGIRRPMNAYRIFFVYLSATILLLAAIFSGLFPPAYIDGVGITPFKILSELIVSVLYAIAIFFFIRHRQFFDPRVLRLLVTSIALTIGSELMFTQYLGVYDLANVIGHYLKIVAAYLLYKAVIETGLVRPLQLLFHNVQQNRDALQKERDFVTAILDSSSALVLVLDAYGRIIRFNRSLEKITGCPVSEVAGLPIWGRNFFPGGPAEVQELFENRLLHSEPGGFEWKLVAQSGAELQVAWSSAVTHDPSGKVEHVVCTGIDITDRKQAEDELRYLSTHDILTGLHNRAHFELEMIRLAETDRFPASVIVADVDGLKAVNDSLGHMAGDKLLQRAAHILRSVFRTEDTVARVGGDEFAVLLPDADSGVAQQAHRRVEALVHAHNQLNPDFILQISMGYATAVAGYMLMETYKHADQAMYQEKAAHRNHITGSVQGPAL